MNARRIVFRLGLLIGLAIVIPGLPATAQITSGKEAQSPAPGLRKLSGDDARRAEELDKAIETALKADHWDHGIARAEELVALRTRAQGPKHFDTLNAEWRLKALRRVALLAHEDRVAYQSTATMNARGEALYGQGKYAETQPLFEKVLAIRRRLLTDDHPETAAAYGNLASSVLGQGNYARSRPPMEKALEICRRLLTDDHPETALCYYNLACNLKAQGKYAEAQPLFEKALEVRRRLFTDDHPETALGYEGVASNLNAQARYAAARALYERALEIRRRLLTDDHPDTASSYNGLALNLDDQGNHAAAQPLHEKALEIRRRLLADNHPETAESYNNLAFNLNSQGKYVLAQQLYEKALEIHRGLFTDDHPHTATSYLSLAYNLNAQKKYSQAQPLVEKALQTYRRLLTDDHPDTARSYNNLAHNLEAQGNYLEAQPLHEKALEIRRRMLTDGHPDTAQSFNNVGFNLDAQGKYTAAQPLLERALEIHRRMLTEDHFDTSTSAYNLAMNLTAQGKYSQARDRLEIAVKSHDAARLRVAFTGLERTSTVKPIRPALAAVLIRLGQPVAAWQILEEDLGRGLLDELAARQDRRLTQDERARLREVTAELERLDKLVETTPKELDVVERAKRFEELKRQRGLASIALGEFQTKLLQDHGPLAGKVAGLDAIQGALPADAALLAWVDLPPAGPNADDRDGEHWGVVVRARGIPAWVPIMGTGPDGLWTSDDSALAARVRSELQSHPGARTTDVRPLVDRLRIQRVEPLAQALGEGPRAIAGSPPTVDGLPPSRRLIILPSGAMAGIPVEVLLAPGDTRTVSYAPSATVFKYLREQPRTDRHAGLLALGDPVYEHTDKSSDPKPLPDHGLLVNVVVPGSNAATRGLKAGDVLLAYNGRPLNKKDDLNVMTEGEKTIVVDIWRDGRSSSRNVAPGKLGVALDPRPAPEAIAAKRAVDKVLVAARAGREGFAPLPGTRYEVEALAKLFQGDDRITRILLGAGASEAELDHITASGELSQFGFIHLATHGVIDEAMPQRSAVILTQTNLPDPLTQVLNHKPVFDGRLSVREIQRGWELKAELVTLSACETALGRNAGGEGFVGFSQALLMSGTRSVCLSLWKVDDTATGLLMQRFYANLLGRRPRLSSPTPKAESLREAKAWLRELKRAEVLALTAEMSRGVERSKGAKARTPAELTAVIPAGADSDCPYASPHFWAAFVLAGDPD